MMNKWILWGILFFLTTNHLFSQQNVGIGTSTPEPRSILEISSSDKGVLLPRLNKAQRLLIDTTTTPINITGLTVFDTDDKNFWFFNGTKWVSMGSSAAATPPTAPKRWSAKGTSDITTNSTFSPMADMSLNITPNNDTVYVTFSASGDVALAATPYPQWITFRCVVNGVTVGGTSIIATDINGSDFAAVWNASLVLPVTVNVGSSNSIVIEWETEDSSGSTPGTVKNFAGTKLNYSHRSLIITE